MTGGARKPKRKKAQRKGTLHAARSRRDPAEVITDGDLWLYAEGRHFKAYRFLGAHQTDEGVHFAVWAPNASDVSVIGDFNGWVGGRNELFPVGQSGIWHAHVPGARAGQRYKYRIRSGATGEWDKSDPAGTLMERDGGTASVVFESSHVWRDQKWMATRLRRNAADSPMSIYECHLGSWRRVDGRLPTYRELARELVEYVVAHGYTHVELLPVMEHPFYGSWGYQVTGYYAPTNRYGDPDDLRALIDALHRRSIGVILDWVPAHFPNDANGLGFFDGTHLYEHADPRRGWHRDWQTYIFNYGRNEVRSFLLSNAIYWLEEFHVDGLRVDAVASMLYRDYSRAEGDWVPNEQGGRENWEAVQFLRDLNTEVRRDFPDVLMIAEESTSWPDVTGLEGPQHLAFHGKWDMGWMHDTLRHLSRDPLFRGFHRDELTFRSMYAANERWILALSHDEVVHLKKALVQKFPGDWWQQRANNRLLFGLQFAHPGKKLMFMGMEFGQPSEWNHDWGLDFELAATPEHAQLQAWVRDLNLMYRRTASLHAWDFDPRGVEWLGASPGFEDTFALIRRGPDDAPPVVMVANLTPLPRPDFRLPVPEGGDWYELLNSDAAQFGGSGVVNEGLFEAVEEPLLWQPCQLRITLPPLGCCFFKPRRRNSLRHIGLK